jgi:serine/threonine protein kinase
MRIVQSLSKEPEKEHLNEESNRSGPSEVFKLLSKSPINKVGKKTVSKRKDSEVSDEYSNNWKKGRVLGVGSFGTVYIGLDQTTGSMMAVKEIKVNSELDKIKSMQEEVGPLRTLSHQNIVRFLGTKYNPTDGLLYIFTEWVSLFAYYNFPINYICLLEKVPGGSLDDILTKFGKLAESVIRKYTEQILIGLAYLHANDVVHMDIKGANILVDDRGTIKLADFGASEKVNKNVSKEDGEENESKAPGIAGSPYFMAPEVIMQKGHGKPADIWSVGCTVYQVSGTLLLYIYGSLDTFIHTYMLS